MKDPLVSLFLKLKKDGLSSEQAHRLLEMGERALFIYFYVTRELVKEI